MSLSARMIVVLTCVGLISGGFLAGVGLLTSDLIEQNKQKEIEAAIRAVVPGTENSQVLLQEEGLTVYRCLKEDSLPAGYAVLAEGPGFQDKITIMFGTDPEVKKLIRMTVLEQKETPGLGAKITSQEDFLRFWDEKEISGSLKLHKPAVSQPENLTSDEINTITGATISSEKVLNIVNLSLDRVKGVAASDKSGREEKNVQ